MITPLDILQLVCQLTSQVVTAPHALNCKRKTATPDLTRILAKKEN